MEHVASGKTYDKYVFTFLIMLAIFIAVIAIGLPDIVAGTIQTIKEFF